MMFEELRKINPNTLEFQKAVAFYMGWLMHYCTDMYTHQYVNLHSYGWFPSISQIGSDAARLLNSPAIAALSQRIKGFLTDAELMDGDFTACLKRIMEDPVAVTELWDMITDSEVRTEYGDVASAGQEVLAEAPGAYMVVGSWTFSAASIKNKDGILKPVAGYYTEELDASGEWTNKIWHEGETEYPYNCETSPACVRLTWSVPPPGTILVLR